VKPHGALHFLQDPVNIVVEVSGKLASEDLVDDPEEDLVGDSEEVLEVVLVGVLEVVLEEQDLP